ncbi:unnamed protein product [Paramecium primaurelia]|uniref:Uncharacterized protein n=2 Tax=Paramecium TaxID=5884 RepID=A0A8S1UTT4_9CILI|nr:unnamed protein product [Paramecium primaurelia]CAD8168530.1 unnamed protein product [Paramecium pentaurelia]
MSDLDQSIEARTDKFESDLNRVSLQQDALLPLLQMIEYIPSIQRTEANVKQVQKKQDINEQKQGRLERCAERKLREIESMPQKPQLEVQQVDQRIKDLESSINCLYRWYEAKLKEGSQQIVRSIDDKLGTDPNAEFNDQLLIVVNQTIKNALDKMSEDFRGQLCEIRQML